MYYSKVASFLFAVVVLASSVRASDVVFGYLPTWQADKAEGVDLKKYSHITIAFAIPDEDGSLSMDNRDEMLGTWIERLSDLQITSLVSLGGWTGTKYMSPIMKSKEKRGQMIDEMVQWMKDYSFDGWDIDFEYPGRQGDSCHPFDPADTDNFLQFLKDLRERLSSEFDSAKLITLATRFQPFDGPAGPLSDVSEFADIVDYFNPMIYDGFGTWSETLGPNAPFNQVEGKGIPFSFKSSVQSWIDAGIPAAKILAGIPFYGRTVTAASDMSGASDMYGSLKKEIPRGDGDDQEESDRSCGGPKVFSGIWKYRNMRTEGVLDSPDTAEGPWLRTFDSDTYSPWLFNPETNDFISYDDVSTVTAKAQYANELGLGGVMIWPLTNDYEDELVDAIRSSIN
ncbi:hypothetical protein GGF46_005394 [Coemansia sp. RSA 552]|nr:hypothetical protein GGF46_005394 [Coemansia sp. RSA 552]